MNIATIAKGLAAMKEQLDRMEFVSAARADPALDGWLKDVLSLPLDERLGLLPSLAPEIVERLRYCWEFWARPEQLQPAGDWTYWLVLAGRGFGKTRTGAETVRIWARDHRYVNIIGATADDVRGAQFPGRTFPRVGR